MRVLLQRVREARVEVDGNVTGSIGPGLLLLVGMTATDDDPVIDLISSKVAGLRISRTWRGG